MNALNLVQASAYASEKNESLEDFNFKGLQVHTEFGDGLVVGTSKTTVRVRLKSPPHKTVSGIYKTKLFVFRNQKKAATNTVETRTRIASLSQLPVRKIGEDADSPITVNPEKKKRRPIPNTDRIENQKINLYALALNGQIAIGIDDEDPDVKPDVLESLGFTFRGPYHYAEISTRRQMENFKNRILTLVEKEAIYVPDIMMEELSRVSGIFKKE